MSHVTGQAPIGALRGRLDLLLHKYRPVLAVENDRLRAAMRDFERDLPPRSAAQTTSLPQTPRPAQPQASFRA